MNGIPEMYYTTDAEPTLVECLRRIDQLERAVAMLMTTDDEVAPSPEQQGAQQVIGSLREGVNKVGETITAKPVKDRAPGDPRPAGTTDSMLRQHRITQQTRTNQKITEMNAKNRQANYGNGVAPTMLKTGGKSFT